MRNLKNRNNKGITLVALVITIIILLILAGISIAQLTGSGLFEKAKLAKNMSESAQIEEETTLADYENKIDEYVGATRNTSVYSITKLGEVTGTTPISIDATKYDELYIETMCPDSIVYCEYSIKTITLKDEHKGYMGQSAYQNGWQSSVLVSKTEVQLCATMRDGRNYASTSKIEVYGIKY